MLATLALAAVAIPQQAPPLTYATKAKRLDQIVRELDELTPLSLESDPDAENHYLVIDVHDVAFDEALQRIADVTDSRWRADGDLRILVPDADLREQQARAEFREWRDLIEQALGKPLRLTAAEKAKIDPAILAAIAPTPTRSMARLIGADAIADIAPGQRVVWSFTPTAMQRKLDVPGASEIVEALILSHNEKYDSGELTTDRVKILIALAQDLGYQFQPSTRIQQPPSEALFVVERYDDSPKTLGFDLVLYGSTGEILAESRDTISIPNLIVEVQTGAPVQPEELDLVEWSPKTLLMLEALEAIYEGKNRDALYAAVGDPVETEPLSLAVSDALLAIARAKRLNLIANVPDSLRLVEWRGPNRLTIQTALQGLARLTEVELKPATRWMLVSPSNEKTERDRFSRTALKRVIEEYLSSGTLGLDALAEYAGTESPIPFFGHRHRYAALFASSLLSPGDWAMLRLWHHFSPTQRTIFAQSGQVRIGALSRDARAVLSRMLFGPSTNLIHRESPKYLTETMGMFSKLDGVLGGDGIWREPTEAMPNGLPADGVIECDASRGFYAGEVFGRAEGLPDRRYDAEAIAGGEDHERRYPQVPFSVFSPGDDLRYGRRLTLSFTFLVSPDAVAVRELVADSAPVDEIVTRKTLPPEFMAEIEALKEQMRTSPYLQLLQEFRESVSGRADPPS